MKASSRIGSDPSRRSRLSLSPVAATALGHTRTRAAGIMLPAMGLAPFLFWGIANAEAHLQTAYMLVSSPMVVTGLLFLLSDRAARRATPPGTEEPGERPLGQAA